MAHSIKKLVTISMVAAAAWGIGVQTTQAATAEAVHTWWRPTFAQPVLHKQESLQKQTALQGVSSYTIYYGAPTPQAIRRLSTYQMVILEPRNWNIDQLNALKKNGTKVLGYLSVLEQNINSSLLQQATDGDYLVIDGQRNMRTGGESWCMNINSDHYRSLLMTDYEQQIVQKGLNGVFLDTVGDADDGIWDQQVSDLQRDGVVQFIAGLRNQYPDVAIVQNWGIGELKDRTSAYIDGILWEDFDPSFVDTDTWSQDRMKELDGLHAKGLSVFTEVNGLNGTEKAQFAKLNRRHGYVGDAMNGDYENL